MEPVSPPYSPTSPVPIPDLDVKYAVPMEIETKINAITELDWTGRSIQDVSKLNDYPDLKSLTWRDLSNDAIVILWTYYKNPKLRKLDIGRTCHESQLITSKPPAEFVSKGLTHLNLSGVLRMTQPVSRHIMHNHPHLVSLDISCTGLVDIRIFLVPYLIALNVSHNYLRDNDFYHIVQAMPQLKELDISHNELTDAGIQGPLGYSGFSSNEWLYRDHDLSFEKLDISNQKTNYVTPQTVEWVQKGVEKRIRRMQKSKERNVEFERKIEERKADQITVSPTELKRATEDPLKIQSVGTLLLENSIEPDQKFDYRYILAFPHLQSMIANYLDMSNPTLSYLAKSRSCTKLILSGDVLDGPYMKSLANAIRRNQVLKQLEFWHGRVLVSFVEIILQSKSIETLFFNHTYIIEREYEQPNERNQKWQTYSLLLPIILNNTALQNLQFYFYDSVISPIIGKHMEDNKKRQEAMTQVAPLLAATQLGGPLRHSSISVLPIVYYFLGIQGPTKSEMVETSKKIEPAQVGEKRVIEETQDRPLPFMFVKPPRQFVSLPSKSSEMELV